MVLVRYDTRMPPNKTLKGHKLLSILGGWAPSKEQVDEVKHKYPHLEIQIGEKDDITRDEWKDVTILVTGFSSQGLPEKDTVPKLQYVQLSSAGANAVVDDPLFKDSDVSLCTANGVHG